MNPYLQRLREQYDGLRTGIEGLQSRAATENRDLTETELASVRTQGEQASTLATQITELTEIETRHSAVASLAAEVETDVAAAAVQNRGNVTLGAARTGTTTTQDRDPGHYARSGEHSFFSDLTHARDGDEHAARRLVEHNRALSTGANGPGVVPPHWLVEEYEMLARQGRPLANAVRNVPLGNDPRPISLPKQTVGTDAAVLEQVAENDATNAADLYDSAVDTVTPKPTAGIQIVSRQMIDMSSPAIDLLIYGDMIAAYNLKVEKKVGAALVTASGAAVTTFATETAFGTGLDASDAVVDAAIAVRNGRKLPADILAMGVVRYGEYLKLKDANGRPLIPQESAGPMNVIGSGSIAVDGRIHGLGVIATDGIATGTYPESVVVLRASDTILFESDTMRFRFEEPLGPESVKLGIWGYTGVIVRQNGLSSKRFVVTAA